MANRPSRLVAPAFAPSYDGRYHLRYPQGDKPATGAEFAASVAAQAEAQAALAAHIRLGGLAPGRAGAAGGLSTGIRLAALAAARANASAVLPGGDGSNDGLIVSNGGTYNSANAVIQSIDVNGNLPVRLTGNASVSYADEPWWNGIARVGTFRPATNVNDTYCGFGGFSIWNTATRVVRQLNVRWEFQMSDQHLIAPLGPPAGPGGGTALPKWLIINTRRQLSTSGSALSDRPMLFLARMNEADSNNNQVANALTLVCAQDTVRAFAATNLVPAPAFGQSGVTTYQNQLVQCIRATSGTTSNGQPIVDNNEYMCVEVRVNVMGTADEPLGVIAARLYRRSSTAPVFERSTAWTNTPNDEGERPLIDTNFIEAIDVGGGGYYNDPSPPGDTEKWTKIGRRITIATNFLPTIGRAWIGPPEGFVI